MGDGGFLFCMEKRGYVKAGVWTPEATVEHPEAGNEVFIAFSFNYGSVLIYEAVGAVGGLHAGDHNHRHLGRNEEYFATTDINFCAQNSSS